MNILDSNKDFEEWMNKFDRIHLSFDMDCLDPSIMCCVNTKVNNISTDDSAGSGGILLRSINSNKIYELGFYKFIDTKDNSGTWNNWMLGDGIFSSFTINF